MAFEEVKAKLGLDIKPFEKGLLTARNAMRGLIGDATKRFTDFKQIGQTVATALGLNLQNIANGIARFAIGFSKDAEERLNNLVTATEEAAKKQEAALATATREQEARKQRIADMREENRLARLSPREREAEIAAEQAELQGTILKLEKGKRTESAEYTRAVERSLILAREQEQITKGIYEEIDKANEARSAAEKEAARAAAETAKKEVERLATLKAQVEALRAQGRAMRDNIADTRRRGELPSMAEVIGGQRNIGSVGRNRASSLERARATALRLSDAEQRARELLAGATTQSARDAALRQGRGIRSRLDAARAAIVAGETSLGGRISDANPFREQLNELKAITAEMKKLNEQTLAPAPLKK